MTSQFSPETFLDTTMDTPLEKRERLPVGDYVGVIGDIAAKTWEKGDKSGVRLEVPIIIDVPEDLQQELELPKTLQFKDSVMLDMTPDGKGLDMSKGKNGRLRTYREATNMNGVGDSFSARKLTGQPVKVKIAHELYNGEIVEKVGGVTKL